MGHVARLAGGKRQDLTLGALTLGALGASSLMRPWHSIKERQHDDGANQPARRAGAEGGQRGAKPQQKFVIQMIEMALAQHGR